MVPHVFRLRFANAQKAGSGHILHFHRRRRPVAGHPPALLAAGGRGLSRPRQWPPYRGHRPRLAGRRAADASPRPQSRRQPAAVLGDRAGGRLAAGLRLLRQLRSLARHPRPVRPVAHRHLRRQRILDQRRRAQGAARPRAGPLRDDAGARLRHWTGAAQPHRRTGPAAFLPCRRPDGPERPARHLGGREGSVAMEVRAGCRT